MTTRTAQQHHEGLNDDMAGVNANAKRQPAYRGPNDDTAGVNANEKGQTTLPQAQRQHGSPNMELGAQGGDSEQSKALLLFYV